MTTGRRGEAKEIQIVERQRKTAMAMGRWGPGLMECTLQGDRLEQWGREGRGGCLMNHES